MSLNFESLFPRHRRKKIVGFSPNPLFQPFAAIIMAKMKERGRWKGKKGRTRYEEERPRKRDAEKEFETEKPRTAFAMASFHETARR